MRAKASAIAVFISVMIFLSLTTLIITTPARVVVPWDEGQCMWLNGTVENKSIELDANGGTNYFFLVNGTLDNETSFHAEVIGSQLDYLLVPIGYHYEGEICDTVPLREAIYTGIIRFIDMG